MARSKYKSKRKERDAFIEQELRKNPKLTFKSCINALKENGLSGIGTKSFSEMKLRLIRKMVVEARPQVPEVVVQRVEMPNECESRTLDIDLSGGVQYTAIRFMKGKSVVAELPMVRA